MVSVDCGVDGLSQLTFDKFVYSRILLTLLPVFALSSYSLFHLVTPVFPNLKLNLFYYPETNLVETNATS